MVWAGSTTSKALNKFGQFSFSQNGFDADGEAGDVIDLFELFNGLKQAPQYASCYLSSSHATAVTDVVSMKLQGSVDGLNWDDLAEITDADVANGGTASEYSDVVSATAFPTIGYRYFRFNCVTVGSGNTLSPTAVLW